MTVEMGSLRLDALSRGRVTYVRLYGTVDETFDVAAFLDAMGGGDVILNLKAIKRMSSFGIREWVNAMKQLRPKVQRIVFVECSPAVVSQLNMIANFAEGADVASVMAPYFCEECEWDLEVPLNLMGTEEPGLDASVTCRRCDAAMVLDDDPENYLAFMGVGEQRPVDPDLDAFLRDFETAAEPPGEASGGDAMGPALWERLLHGRWRRLLSSPRGRWIALAGGAAAFLLILGVIVASSSGDGISGEELETYHALLGEQKFGEATEFITSRRDAGTLSERGVEAMLADIESRRQQTIELLRKQGREALARKRYEESAAAYQRAMDLGCDDNDARFRFAEALRRSQGLDAAVVWYERFAENAAQDHPRKDDAIFWQAEFHASRGDAEKARTMFQSVINDFARSDFRRSAKKRLRTSR